MKIFKTSALYLLLFLLPACGQRLVEFSKAGDAGTDARTADAESPMSGAPTSGAPTSGTSTSRVSTSQTLTRRTLTWGR